MSGSYVFQVGRGDPNLPQTWTDRGRPSEPAHELEGLLDRVAADLASDYDQIRARASEDPGTAGDQSEETWAELFRRWLPPGLAVATKGRILSVDGRATSQVDVVVLRDTYPRALAQRKIYMAAGVLAAFECKLTLRPATLRSSLERGREIKRVIGPDRFARDLRSDLISPFAFGVLAHAAEGISREVMDRALKAHLGGIDEPREAADVVCVANLGTWSAVQILVIPTLYPGAPEVWPEAQALFGVGATDGVHAAYGRWSEDLGYGPANPTYALIGFLLRRLAGSTGDGSALANYWGAATVRGNALAAPAGRSWPASILSTSVRSGLERKSVTLEPGEDWSPIFY